VPWFLWIVMALWVIGILYLIYSEFTEPENTELEGWADYFCSVVIMMLWPLWGAAMLYFRFKSIKKIKPGSFD